MSEVQTQRRKFVTKTRVSGVAKSYRKWEQWDVGDIVIGKFHSTHTDQYKKVCPVIQVEECYFKNKKDNLKSGTYLVLNSCGKLDKAMENVGVGQYIQIEYTGTAEILKGPYAGKEAHNMEVDIVEMEDSSEEGL